MMDSAGGGFGERRIPSEQAAGGLFRGQGGNRERRDRQTVLEGRLNHPTSGTGIL